MDETRALTVARAAVEAARAAGAGDGEATVTVAQRFSCEARDRTVSKLEQSTAVSLSVRIFIDGRKASFSTSDLAPENIRDAMARVVAQARFVQIDPHAGLPDECGSIDVAALELFDDALRARTDDARIADALGLERAIRDADPRILNSGGSHYADAIVTAALANSRGFSGVHTGTRASLSTSPVAIDGRDKRTASYGTAARALGDLEPVATVASIAVRRTTDLFGARKPPTKRLPVIFERDVAASVLHDVFAALNAANVANGNSWLIDRVGERVGSALVSIIDDGTLARGLGTLPFDGEGSPTRRTVVFDQGVLRTFLYDTYHARRLGARTTGNASAGGIGPNNFFLQSGSQSLADLIAATEEGVLVLDTIGFATEHATGSYSRGARGFFIEGGELAYPIDECTIAATFPQMLAGIDAVANDLRFDGTVVSPSFRVAEMTISGN